jgi:hypothetical protein
MSYTSSLPSVLPVNAPWIFYSSPGIISTIYLRVIVSNGTASISIDRVLTPANGIAVSIPIYLNMEDISVQMEFLD